jgi:hypothetical protein
MRPVFIVPLPRQFSSVLLVINSKVECFVYTEKVNSSSLLLLKMALNLTRGIIIPQTWVYKSITKRSDFLLEQLLFLCGLIKVSHDQKKFYLFRIKSKRTHVFCCAFGPLLLL